MCEKIFNWLKKQFGQNSPSTPEEQKQDVQTIIPSSPEGQNATSTEANSSTDVVGVSVENEILKRVTNIEEYLRLSEVKSRLGYIDFSYIIDANTRNKLEQDHNIMWHCRLGIREHKVEFDAFCIYISVQIECLLRYYQNFKEEQCESVSSMMVDFYKTLYGKTSFTDEYEVLNATREVRNVYMHSLQDDAVKRAKRYIKDNKIKIHYKSFNGELFQEIDDYLRKTDEKSAQDADQRKEEFKKETEISVNTYHNYIKAEILKKHESFELVYNAFKIFCSKMKQRITKLQ